MSLEKSNTKTRSRYIVAVGAAKCGKTTALDSLIDGNMKKYAMRIPYTEGLRQNHVEAFLKKKKCTTLTVEALLDVDARDTFTSLIESVIEKQHNVGKHIHQETRSFFEVPQSLRKHVSAVVVFKSANEDERRRIYRYFASAFFAKREDFDEVLNSLVSFDCLLMEKTDFNVGEASIYNALSGVKSVLPNKCVANPEEVKKQVEEVKKEEVKKEEETKKEIENKKPIGYKKWFWSFLGY